MVNNKYIGKLKLCWNNLFNKEPGTIFDMVRVLSLIVGGGAFAIAVMSANLCLVRVKLDGLFKLDGVYLMNIADMVYYGDIVFLICAVLFVILSLRIYIERVE